MNAARRGLVAALLGGLLLGLATPPAVAPGAEFLVLPGLALWAWLIATSPRPQWHSYWFGCVHMAWFSWSLHHVLWFAYGAVVVLGGLYFAAAAAVVRSAPAAGRVVWFGVAAATAFWLRAEFPGIHYPHGQPCHALWQWPQLLAVVAIGGEPLANALLAMLAAALSQWPDAGRRRRAAGTAVAVGVVWAVLAALGAPTPPAADAARLTLGLVEPGLHPLDTYAGLRGAAFQQRHAEVVATRLVAPTAELLQGPPLDLLLWPESSLFDEVPVAAIAAGQAALLPGRLPAAAAPLLLGATVRRGDQRIPAALQVELPGGRIVAHYEKQRLVPGGEFVPALAWLPEFASAWLRRTFATALAGLPDLTPGQPQPLLRAAGGVPLGVLLCYDNAFPAVARAHAAAGARLLVVLSNEAWYRGGAELDQLLAMSVCRALETGLPVVRCTTDGQSAVVDAAGRVLARLPRQTAPTPAARIFRSEVSLPPAAERPMAWCQAAAGPAMGLLAGLLLLHGRRRRARLLATWPPPAAGGS